MNDTGYGINTKGPARWERAALNAMRHPLSEAAGVYRDRVRHALAVSEVSTRSSTNDTWAFEILQYATPSKFYYVCSLYCMVMQGQLHYGSMTHVTTALMSYKIRAKKPSRVARCQVCAKKIKP